MRQLIGRSVTLLVGLVALAVASVAAQSGPRATTIGGSGFTLRPVVGGIETSWQTGNQQTAYLLLRWSPQSNFAFLPSPTNLLSAGATTYTDSAVLVDPTYCYVLLPLGGNPPSFEQVLGLTDLLCVYPGTRSGSAPPAGFGVRLDQSPLVSLSWSG